MTPTSAASQRHLIPDAANANPLCGDFLPLRTCVQILSGDNGVNAVHEVPPGVKENVWFFVNRMGNRSIFSGDKFWDDCGAWSKRHGTKSWHLPDSLAEVRLMTDGLYGMRGKVEGLTLKRLDPQPSSVLCVHRMYTRLAVDNEYQRRITYIDNVDCFIAEYLGEFPKLRKTHGNASKSCTEYTRTRPDLLADLAATCAATRDSPLTIYNQKDL